MLSRVKNKLKNIYLCKDGLADFSDYYSEFGFNLAFWHIIDSGFPRRKSYMKKVYNYISNFCEKQPLDEALAKVQRKRSGGGIL